MKNRITLLAIISVPFFISSCQKFLDAKPDQRLVIPTTIPDLQALLDNGFVNNQKSPSWDEASADNYYLLQEEYDALQTYEQKAYTWEDFQVNYSNDWSILYDGIYYSNVALKGLENIEKASLNQADWNNVKGSALIFRAQGFLRAAIIFCKVYDDATAQNDLGIALRETPDFTEQSVRSNLRDSYDKILQDLKEAALLLPVTPKHVMRPSRTAAFALLARTYLAMSKFDSAFKYADLSLQLKSDLMDFNTDVDPNNLLFPISQFNKEVIFSSVLGTFVYRSISPSRSRVDSTLFNSYDNNDLRKDVYFLDASLLGSTGYVFQGTYDGSFSDLFIGIATDEVWLMRAECNARLNNKDAALNDLNVLMKMRWRNNGTWLPYTATTAQEALSLILTERRKELIFRGLRWMDIKRLNREGADINLKRIINGQMYSLAPNDPRYALLLPQDIINLTGMPQNPR